MLDFARRFPNEKACIRYLKTIREKEGIFCRQCHQDQEHYWLPHRNFWQCKICGSKTNLRAGTVMEKSKIPLLYWFKAIHFITTTVKPFSALEMQHQIGHKRYEPVWYMMHKLRRLMADEEDRHRLRGEVQADEGFYEVVLSKAQRKAMQIKQPRKNEENLKRGRGSERQGKVLVLTEVRSNPENRNIHRPSSSFRRVKFIVMDGLTIEGINFEISKHVSRDSVVVTDSYAGYNKLPEVVKEHRKLKVKPTEAHKLLPWVHSCIGNAKRELLGTHHSIGKDYLQPYLTEHAYKLNRRYDRDTLFEDLMKLCATEKLL